MPPGEGDEEEEALFGASANMANKHLELGNALFDEEGAEGEAAMERRAVDDSQWGVPIEAKFEEGGTGRTRL